MKEQRARIREIRPFVLFVIQNLAMETMFSSEWQLENRATQNNTQGGDHRNFEKRE